MELRQTFDFNEKKKRIINNRNLKEYSCFIGVKTEANAVSFIFIWGIIEFLTKLKPYLQYLEY